MYDQPLCLTSGSLSTCTALPHFGIAVACHTILQRNSHQRLSLLSGGSDVCTIRPTPAQGQGAQQPDEQAAGAALCGALHRLGACLHVPLSPCGPGPGPLE